MLGYDYWDKPFPQVMDVFFPTFKLGFEIGMLGYDFYHLLITDLYGKWMNMILNMVHI